MQTAYPHELPFRWRVQSATRGIEHLVDLESNAGYGWCGCEHHQFRCQPLLDQGRPAPHRCRHLVAARGAFTDLMISKLTTTLPCTTQTTTSLSQRQSHAPDSTPPPGSHGDRPSDPGRDEA